MTSIHPPEPGLVSAVRAGAAGLYSLEAACELVISTGWLHRDDFARFIRTGTSLTDGVTELACIDWQSAIAGRESGLLPCSSGENRILRLAASIAAGIPVDLNDALTGLDQARITLVLQAVRHANGQRPADYAGSRRYDMRHMQSRESPHGTSPSARNFRTPIGQAESLHGSTAHGECGEKSYFRL